MKGECKLLCIVEAIYGNSHVYLVSRHNFNLWELRCPFLIHAKSNYENFIQITKAYTIIGPMRTQSDTLCLLIGC